MVLNILPIGWPHLQFYRLLPFLGGPSKVCSSTMNTYSACNIHYVSARQGVEICMTGQR